MNETTNANVIQSGPVKKDLVSTERLKSSLNGRFNHDDFAEHARASASSNGCCYLFDFPASLLDEDADNAAAILCPDTDGHRIVFLTYVDELRQITVVEATEAPIRLVDFAWSFARVLSFLPYNRQDSVN